MREIPENFESGIGQKQFEKVIEEVGTNPIEPKSGKLNDVNLENSSPEEIEKANFAIALKEEIVKGLLNIRLGKNVDLGAVDEIAKNALLKEAEKIVLWAIPLHKSVEKKDLTGKGEGLVQGYFQGDEPTL